MLSVSISVCWISVLFGLLLLCVLSFTCGCKSVQLKTLWSVEVLWFTFHFLPHFLLYEPPFSQGNQFPLYRSLMRKTGRRADMGSNYPGVQPSFRKAFSVTRIIGGASVACEIHGWAEARWHIVLVQWVWKGQACFLLRQTWTLQFVFQFLFDSLEKRKHLLMQHAD